MHRSSTEHRRYGRTGGQLVTTLVCLGALTACGGDRSDRPSATAATEPERKTAPANEQQRVIAETAKTSERLADQSGTQAGKARDDDRAAEQPRNQQSDLERATSIRQALLDADGLSAGARNVNVAVDQGRITLRGRVENEVEKTRVESTARTAAGSARIVNELEVGP